MKILHLMYIFTCWLLVMRANTMVSIRNTFRSVIDEDNSLLPQYIENTKKTVLSVGDILKLYDTGILEFLAPLKKKLLAIRRESQELHAHHKYQILNDFEYYNRADNSLPVKKNVTGYLPTTGVNINASFVQVPTDVYNRNISLLNEIKWSDGLDELFIRQLREEPAISWQYIGFITGASRTYPGSHLQE